MGSSVTVNFGAFSSPCVGCVVGVVVSAAAAAFSTFCWSAGTTTWNESQNVLPPVGSSTDSLPWTLVGPAAIGWVVGASTAAAASIGCVAGTFALGCVAG